MYSTIIRLVNDTHPLPDEHNAAGLISLYSLTDRAFYLPPSNMLLNCDAAGALNDMCRAAGEEGGFECIITDAYPAAVSTRQGWQLILSPLTLVRQKN